MRLSSFLLLVIFSQVASAHPGKTDYQDGHKCLKNCRDWDLYYSEYHLHDKDRNPIRVERKKKPVKMMAPESKAESETPVDVDMKAPLPLPLKTDEQVIRKPDQEVAAREYSQPVAEGCVLTFYDILLLGVAGLLILLLLRMRIKERKNKSL